jgi:hypothetical protein
VSVCVCGGVLVEHVSLNVKLMCGCCCMDGNIGVDVEAENIYLLTFFQLMNHTYCLLMSVLHVCLYYSQSHWKDSKTEIVVLSIGRKINGQKQSNYHLIPSLSDIYCTSLNSSVHGNGYGRLLASGTEESNEILLWNPADGTILTRLPGVL